MAEFKLGDTVRLKSGGPLMTIESIDEYEIATCVWFDKKVLSSSQFNFTSIEIENEDLDFIIS